MFGATVNVGTDHRGMTKPAAQSSCTRASLCIGLARHGVRPPRWGLSSMATGMLKLLLCAAHNISRSARVAVGVPRTWCDAPKDVGTEPDALECAEASLAQLAVRGWW